MKLFVKNGKPPKARENAADRATIGARFASDWLRGWRDGPIAERVKAKPKS